MNSSYKTNETSRNWWERHRAKYNLALILAGIGAFICYGVVLEIFGARLGPDAEITILTTLIQGVGYYFGIFLANIFYFIGPISEEILKPKDVHRYRKYAYGMGYWGSVALPFSIPVILSILCLLPEQNI